MAGGQRRQSATPPGGWARPGPLCGRARSMCSSDMTTSVGCRQDSATLWSLHLSWWPMCMLLHPVTVTTTARPACCLPLYAVADLSRVCTVVQDGGLHMCFVIHECQCHADMPFCVQKRAFATGLDTGCCYGDRLTAAILPSLHNLRAKQQEDQSGSRLLRPLDPDDVQIISVPAHETYYHDDACQ